LTVDVGQDERGQGMIALSPAERQRLTTAVWVALLPGAMLFAVMQVRGYASMGTLGLDSHAYWLAATDPSSWYTRPVGYRDAYLYSPVLAQVLSPFAHVPWPVFQGLWAAAGVVGLVWLLLPLGALRGVVVGLFLLPDVLIGNVYVMLAVVLVLMLGGWPGVLAFPLVTKISPGVVLLWFVVRREWRACLWAVGSTVAVVAVSYAADREAWVRWLDFLRDSAGARGTGTPLRVIAGALVTAFAARRSKAWLLAPAVLIASPNLEGYAVFAVLAAIPRLLIWQQAHEPAGPARLRAPRDEGRSRIEDVDVADPKPLAP